MGQNLPGEVWRRGIAASQKRTARYSAYSGKAGCGVAGKVPDERDGLER